MSPRGAVGARQIERARALLGMLRTYANPVLAIRERLASTYPQTQGIARKYRLRQGPSLLAEAGPDDVHMINEVWVHRTYALDANFIPRPSWNVVDVGAHKGFFAVWAGLQMRQGRILCFEPDPYHFRYLVQNVAQLGQAIEVECHNQAVAGSDGKRTLYRLPTLASQHSLYRARSAARATHEREVVQPILSDACSLATALADLEEVDLLKLDVEGSEYEILLESSAEGLLKVRRVVLEYDQVDPRNSGVRSSELVSHLQDVGFQVSHAKKWPLLFASRRPPSHGVQVR